MKASLSDTYPQVSDSGPIKIRKDPAPPNRGGRGCHVWKRQRSNTGEPLNLGNIIVAILVFAFDSFFCVSASKVGEKMC